MLTSLDMLDQIINPAQGDLAADLARYILTLDFPQAVHESYEKLAEKAQEGTLTDEERVDIDFLLNMNNFISILQAKARFSLKNQAPPS